ncbi:MAG: hypothetical protein M3Q77_09505 [Thermoproteota archaeon]|nr:hypothetical protein [Nitrosopumilus sp.]MDQ3085029.1 hypothetical protein [Thermoproteota archaeon]
MKDNKSLLPLLEGRVWITSVINKILSKSINNNLCWLEGDVTCEIKTVFQTMHDIICKLYRGAGVGGGRGGGVAVIMSS